MANLLLGRMTVLGVLSALAGCSGLAETSSIYHNRTVVKSDDDKGAKVSAVTVDAKQRSVYVSVPPAEAVVTATTTTTYKPTAVGKPREIESEVTRVVQPVVERVRMCAEPSPDIFSAYSASATGDINIALVNTGVDQNEASGSGTFTGAMGETAAALERTQAMNLIRESMYRTCERYLNGAISDDELMIQASRDHRSMLAFLTIEQLTAPLRPAPVVIGGPGLSVGGSGIDAAKQLNDATLAQARAEAAKNQAEVVYKEKAAIVTANEAACKTPANEDAKKKCQEDKDAAAKAKANAEEAAILLAAANTSVKQWTQVAALAAGSSGSVNGTDPVLLSSRTEADAKSIAAVALTVEKIFNEANDFHEFGMACIVKYRRESSMSDLCDEYIKGMYLNGDNNVRTKRDNTFNESVKSLGFE